MRLAFLGTPEAAVPTLRGLVSAGHDVAVVVSRPDKRRGRGAGLVPSPVKKAATDLGLEVTAAVDDVLGRGVELGVVVAYGSIIRPPVLGSVPLVNIHFSLLPRWRGAAPVERAILAGDTVTGVCLMEIEEGLDTGGVYRTAQTPIGSEETAEELRARLAVMGRDLLVDALASGLGDPRPQEGEPTYASRIEPDERRLDWEASAEHLLRVIRIGRAWTTLQGKRLLVLAAAPAPGDSLGAPGSLAGTAVATGNGAVRLVAVQPEGRAATDAEAWARGARLGSGARLGT